MKSYVFRQRPTSCFSNVSSQGFVLIASPSDLLRHWQILISHFGVKQFVIQAVKSLFRNRFIYFIAQSGRIVSLGSLSLGFCKYYPVAPDSVVIGSIWTDPECRGRGLAARGMKAVMNLMMDRARGGFYIDTQEHNFGMLKAIENSGFGQPVSEFNA